MERSVQGVWDRFERWTKRYKIACHKAIEEMFKCGYSEFDNALYLRKWHELNQDIILDLNISESELSNRIYQKIDFLRGYLVDITFDGPEFMAKHSDFLTLQYPSQCNNAIGVWLEQRLDSEVEAGGYSGFQEFDVNVFCRSIADIDLASMRNVLPFDRMFLRRPKGKAWDVSSIRSIVQQVKEDIEFDYEVQVKPDNGPKDLLSINFTWE